MNGPPRDDSTDDDGDPEPADDRGSEKSVPDPDGSTADDGVPTEEFDPPTGRSDTSSAEAGAAERESADPTTGGPSAGEADPTSSGPDTTTSGTDTRSEDFDDPIGDLLPHASVDSRWWYWIAAIPLYVVLGGVLAVLFVGAFLFDIFLTGGLVTLFGAFVVVPILGLFGLLLSIMYPIATYVDARAIAESDASWTPDPLVWGLAALATEVLSAFVLSVVLALFYLYKRHVAVGTP